MSSDLSSKVYLFITIELTKGSTGEAVSLTRDERRQIIAAVRQGLDDAHHEEVVIVAGIGAGCTREAIDFARDAAESGAICGISLCPSYFIGQVSDKVIVDYYTSLADMSPIPILICNEHRSRDAR